MPENAEFSTLMDRVRRGDANAAEELVRQYESQLRVIARVRLRDPRLRRTLDTMDICQSVLANFFVRATAGQFDLDSPEQLVKLLGQMVRNKVTDQARRETAERRDVGRLSETSSSEQAAVRDTASQIVSAQELASLFNKQLSANEQELIRLRRAGHTWDELAIQFGGSPEALRKRLGRAIDDAARAVGLERGGQAEG